MSRADEIAQGLREETGGLIGGLHVEDYNQGFIDFEAGVPPPRGLTSTSYDLGRRRASERAESAADFATWQAAQDAKREASMRDILKDHPVALEEYLAKIAEIRAGGKPK